MSAAAGVLDLIGNTQMARINRFDTGVCELFLKLENQNPTGSIKDRIALSMIDAAEAAGSLIAAALRYCRAQKQPKRVVTFVCDSGNK